MAKGQIRLQLVNTRSSDRTLMLEPWTTEYVLKPQTIYEIIAEGDTSLPIRIELTAEGITVGALDSEGAGMSILENGKRVASTQQ